MRGDRGRKTRSRAAWLVTWMAWIAIEFALSTPQTTAANLSCASPSAAEDAHAPQIASAQVCAILPAGSQDGEA